MMFIQDRAIVCAVLEDTDARDILPRVITHRVNHPNHPLTRNDLGSLLTMHNHPRPRFHQSIPG